MLAGKPGYVPDGKQLLDLMEVNDIPVLVTCDRRINMQQIFLLLFINVLAFDSTFSVGFQGVSLLFL